MNFSQNHSSRKRTVHVTVSCIVAILFGWIWFGTPPEGGSGLASHLSDIAIGTNHSIHAVTVKKEEEHQAIASHNFSLAVQVLEEDVFKSKSEIHSFLIECDRVGIAVSDLLAYAIQSESEVAAIQLAFMIRRQEMPLRNFITLQLLSLSANRPANYKQLLEIVGVIAGNDPRIAEELVRGTYHEDFIIRFKAVSSLTRIFHVDWPRNSKSTISKILVSGRLRELTRDSVPQIAERAREAFSL